eukprot:365725-Chlamydomonas_euryale.AAC.51
MAGLALSLYFPRHASQAPKNPTRRLAERSTARRCLRGCKAGLLKGTTSVGHASKQPAPAAEQPSTLDSTADAN